MTVTGTPASGIFLVFTKDQASTISKIRNGYLGWHYVNQIDTCMYASSPTQFVVGTNKIVWNGKNQDGKTVPAGSYTYYLWAYDNIKAKEYAAPMSYH